MPRKNRRDPFAGVPEPGSRHSAASILRQVVGRMRNIAFEKHRPKAEGDAAIEAVVDELRRDLAAVADQRFAPGDAAVRASETASVLARHADAADRLGATNLAGTWRRWSERLGEIAGRRAARPGQTYHSGPPLYRP